MISSGDMFELTAEGNLFCDEMKAKGSAFSPEAAK